MKIYKYLLGNSLLTPHGDVLMVGLDTSLDPCVWIQVNEDRLTPCWEYRIYATGESPSGNHVGSYVKGGYVGHVYRVPYFKQPIDKAESSWYQYGGYKLPYD